MCISTTPEGQPCPRKRGFVSVPYCIECMATGDPSLSVQQHPTAGKVLCAVRDLPAGYKVGWWGHVYNSASSVPAKAMDWCLEVPSPFSKKATVCIDATPHDGSLLKYCSCVGPNEVASIGFARNSDIFLDRAGKVKDRNIGTVMFALRVPVPRGTLVQMTYATTGDSNSQRAFFDERNIERDDVGTKEHPALLKRNFTRKLPGGNTAATPNSQGSPSHRKQRSPSPRARMRSPAASKVVA